MFYPHFSVQRLEFDIFIKDVMIKRAPRRTLTEEQIKKHENEIKTGTFQLLYTSSIWEKNHYMSRKRSHPPSGNGDRNCRFTSTKQVRLV